MVAQTSYAINTDGAYPGLIRDINPKTVVSYLAEDTLIPFGVVVTQGTADNQALIGGVSGTDGVNILGVTVRDLAHEGDPITGVLNYKENETMAVLQKGYIYAITADAVSPGDPVVYATATGLLGTTTGAETYTGAIWRSSAGVGEIAVLQVDA